MDKPVRVVVLLPQELAARLDGARRTASDLPTRPEALRRGVALALGLLARDPSFSPLGPPSAIPEVA
jgi:hypothetical protein